MEAELEGYSAEERRPLRQLLSFVSERGCMQVWEMVNGVGKSLIRKEEQGGGRCFQRWGVCSGWAPQMSLLELITMDSFLALFFLLFLYLLPFSLQMIWNILKSKKNSICDFVIQIYRQF